MARPCRELYPHTEEAVAEIVPRSVAVVFINRFWCARRGGSGWPARRRVEEPDREHDESGEYGLPGQGCDEGEAAEGAEDVEPLGPASLVGGLGEGGGVGDGVVDEHSEGGEADHPRGDRWWPMVAMRA